MHRRRILQYVPYSFLFISNKFFNGERGPSRVIKFLNPNPGGRKKTSKHIIIHSKVFTRDQNMKKYVILV